MNLIKANPGISVSRLAKETGVSERTIYRDILSLSSSVPVYYEEGYRLLDTAFLPTLNFNSNEYKLLKLALNCCALKRDDLQRQAKSLLSKIDAVVDPKIRSIANSLLEFCKIYCRQTYRQKHISTFAQILDKAIQGNHKIKLNFESIGDGVAERIVQPYSLVFSNHSWYLLGFCELLEDFCMLNLEHIKRITLSDESFQKDSNFSIEKFLENKWEILGGKPYNVKVKFKGVAAKLILSSQHHPKEKVTKQKDGSVIYAINVEGLEEIARWILTFGDEAEVIKPTELRQKITLIVRNLARFYFSTELKEKALKILKSSNDIDQELKSK